MYFVAVKFIFRIYLYTGENGDNFEKVETSAKIQMLVNCGCSRQLTNGLGYFSLRVTPSSILMILHVAILSKSFATYFARKWLFLHMNDFMTFQSAFGFKSFIASATCM